MTSWRHAGTAANSWSLLDRAHSGFWDDTIIEITATAVPTPVSHIYTARFDANMFASGFGLTATATMQATFCVLGGDLVVAPVATATSTFKNAAFDGRLAQTVPFANPVFFNSVLLATEVTVNGTLSADFDIILERDGVSAVSSYDAVLASAARIPSLFSLDALLSANVATTTKTLGINAELKAAMCGSVNFDALLAQTRTRSLNLDATALKTIQTTKTSSLDGLFVKTISPGIVADAVFLKTLVLTNSVSLNALLFQNVHPYALFDSFLNLTFAQAGADAVIVSGTPVTTTTLAVGMDATTQVFPITGSVDAVVAGGHAGFFFFS